jgi:hypothetical protein
VSDIFLEQRVVRELKPRDYGVRFVGLVAIVAVVVVTAAGLRHPGVTLALGIAGGFGLRSLVRRQRREYEYAFTNGCLDIDVIYSRAWRRQLYSLDVATQVQLMARVNDPEHRSALQRQQTVVHLGCGEYSETSYFLVLRQERGEIALIWDPSPELVQACRRVAPRVVVP